VFTKIVAVDKGDEIRPRADELAGNIHI